jgi:hypothetical protein
MKKLFLFVIAAGSLLFVQSQELKELIFDHSRPFTINELKIQGQAIPVAIPFFSIEINKKLSFSNDAAFHHEFFDAKLHLLIEPDTAFKEGYAAKLVFLNNGNNWQIRADHFCFNRVLSL